MSIADQIIERLDSGEKPKAIAGQYTWNSIPPTDRQKLGAEAERRSITTDRSDALLQALYFLTRKADEWESLRALALIIRRPDLEFERKKDGLEHIRQALEKARNKLTQHDTAAIRRYNLQRADYYALSADVLQEGNSGATLAQVIKLYQDAQGIWQNYGEAERAEWAEGQIQTLQNMIKRGEHLLPIELLRSERSALNSQIQELHSQAEAAQVALTTTEESNREASARVAQLKKQIEGVQEELSALQSKLAERRREITHLETQVREYEPALYFLMELPHAATAPLWVEVVRIALEQGDIDDLTPQALERLIVPYPDEALPLLAEIAARAPEPFAIPAGTFQNTAATWFAGIAEARALMEENMEAAARRLVDAWDAFFEGAPEAPTNE